MLRSAVVCVVVFTSLAYASPANKVFSFDASVEEARSLCVDGNDSFECIKYKVMDFLKNVAQKDSFKIGNDIEVRSNGYTSPFEQRSEKDVIENVQDYLQSHDVTVNLPAADAKVTISPRQLNDGEFDLKVKFSDVESRGKKHKLRKLMVPLFVFILLKAMTLVPLALGVLGLKAWNALQLSFFSFIISFALAIFQLCKKLAVDNHTPAIVPTHAHFEHAARSFFDDYTPSEEGQDLAYNAYA